MNLAIDFKGITSLLETAHNQGRDFLFEYEVYSLLACSGAEAPPANLLIPRGNIPPDDELNALPGDKAVLKIVSPLIIHKTEVGGVRIVEKKSSKIRSTVRRMLYEVPENYALWIERYPQAAPEKYRTLGGEALIAAISRDLKGVLQVQFMPPDSMAFGNELIVGLRRTREFGTVISAGLGGTDTELYAKRFRKGQAIVAGSTKMHDGDSFFQIFKKTISYRKLAGLTRGQRRIVTDEQLIECFEAFIQLGNHFSPCNPENLFVLEELEINPFTFTDYLMVPLDGMCRFSLPEKREFPRPVSKIDRLLHPKSIGIIGVSIARKNFGRIILDNILAEGFNPEKLVIIRDGIKQIDGIECVPDISFIVKKMNRKLDLLIVAVDASQVPDIVDDVITLDGADSVMLIPGGMGETLDSQDRARLVIKKIRQSHGTEKGGPVFLGANCMGVISRPGGYDTWFIPEEKLPKERNLKYHRAVLISQSGAFMAHRSHQCPELRPAYMISMGNQTDLTLGDMILYFKDSKTVDVIAVYAEGFKDLDGLEFCRGVHDAVLNGKDVIFYKAGRTPEGKAATSGHTASLAGDYMVCESCVGQAGAIVARNFNEFQELFFLAENLSRKRIRGNRLAAVSSAGFEAVGMADSIVSDDFHMKLARFEKRTFFRITRILKKKKLDAFVTLTNPLDINPGADDETHGLITEALVDDDNVDAIVVSLAPLSPSMRTLADHAHSIYDMDSKDSIKNIITNIAAKSSTPIVTVVDGGRLYDPLRDALTASGVPVFTVCDRAVNTLSLYMQGRLAADAIRGCHGC